MRQAVTISIPKTLDAAIETFVKQKFFASKSEFVRTAIRNLMDQQTFRELKKSEADVVNGRVRKIKTGADIWK